MNKKISKFLEFNGKTLYFLSKNGEYWIALKPICEALGVEYTRTFKNAKANPIYSQLLAVQPMVGADGKARKMVTLPEKRIYGWLMGIQSNSPGLIEYQTKCHDILFDYFHGTITNRKELLAQKARAKKEIDEIMNSLETDQALKLDRNQRLVNQINAELRKLDNEVIEEEYDLFSTQ
jgi:hypothetical protein